MRKHRNTCGAAVLCTPSPDYFPILHLRDNLPGVSHPGMLHVWGGRAEGKETGHQAMMREVEEETGLADTRVQTAQFVGKFLEHTHIVGWINKVHVYVIKGVDPTEIDLHEGAGFIVVENHLSLSGYTMTWLAQTVLGKLSVLKLEAAPAEQLQPSQQAQDVIDALHP